MDWFKQQDNSGKNSQYKMGHRKEMAFSLGIEPLSAFDMA